MQFLQKAAGSALVECDYNNADFLLFDILCNCNIEGTINFNFGDSSVSLHCIYYCKLNMTAMYIRNNIDLRSFKKDALLRISRVQFGPGLFPYGLVTQHDILRYAFYITRESTKKRHYGKYPTLDSWFEKTTQPPKLKVSASHLRHLTMNDMIRIGKENIYKELDYMLPCLELLAKKGMHEAMFVGLITWAMLLTPKNKQLSRNSGIWLWQFDSVADFATRIKTNFSLRLKALQNLVEADLEQFFELEVLVNRGVGAVDWAAEREHRVTPNTNQIPDIDIFAESVKLFKKLKERGSRPKKTDWKRFWASRWGWAPTGAYHSQYTDDHKYKAKDSTLRNKLFAVARMPKREFSHFINKTPQIVAWPSVKYEWGKQRAIYGVDFTNFVMTNFALYKCEELLEPIFPVGRAAKEDVVAIRVKETLRNGIPYCFDFEDFNSQHTNRNMQDVLNAYALVFAGKMTPEQQEALNWVIASVANGEVLTDEGSYRLNGTLLSGWRLTTFVNTILNHVYIKFLTKNEPIVSLHNGDDVLAGISTLSQVQNLQSQASKYNIRFQRSKCFLGSIAEFLRVDHNKGVGAQYLARGVSTFVHGPTESVVPNDLISLMQSLKARKQELLDRDANPAFVDQCYALQLQRVSRLWDITESDLAIIQNTHLSKGGISTEITTNTLSHEITRLQLRSIEMNTEDNGDSLSMPGVWDYADQLCKRIIDETYKNKLIKSLQEATLAATVKNKFGVVIQKIIPDMFDTLRAKMNGLLRHTQHGTKAMIAKAYGIPLFGIIGELDEIFDRISQETDPISAMKILL